MQEGETRLEGLVVHRRRRSLVIYRIIINMPEITTATCEEEDDDENSLIKSNSNNSIFKKYELGKLLGRGAFAKVYHARDLRTGQSVAIKSINKKQQLLEGYMINNNNNHLIKREVSIMRRLRHPHIVRLHEVLATKTKIFFVMDFAKGGELFAKVARGRFTEDLSRKYFQQLISAVDYCHSHGVFHRDLKPENLLLDDNWDLKVTDFGFSALADHQTRPDGLLHTLCGTPAYVAPEILAKKGYDGAKADVWSCGVILFVLNAGYLPFNDTNLMAMYRKIYRGEFRCPKWTSPELKRFLGRILDPNPGTRITIREILSDPWFSRGGYNKEVRHPVDREFELKGDDHDHQARYLNAFDLISYSPGADLSGLFASGNRSVVESEMFVSSVAPERIIERVEALAEEEGMRVAKKGMGVRLHGQNWKYVLMVEVNRLTDALAVVEVKRSGFGRDLWKERFRPRLNDLIHGPELQVAHN